MDRRTAKKIVSEVNEAVGFKVAEMRKLEDGRTYVLSLANAATVVSVPLRKVKQFTRTEKLDGSGETVCWNFRTGKHVGGVTVYANGLITVSCWAWD